MVRALMVFSTLALISAGIVFVLCLVQILQGTQATEWNPGIPVIEKLTRAGYTETSCQETVSPLVKQAETFALYLNSPQAQESKEARIPTSRPMQSISASGASKSTPKFKLLATSHYRSRPEESMALVSEPGSGAHWVKRGAHLGLFVVEKIKRGVIIYRNGDRLGEMAVDKKVPVRMGRVPRITLASAHTSSSPSRSSNAGASNRKNGKLLHKLGLPQPETRPIAYGHETRDSGQ